MAGAVYWIGQDGNIYYGSGQQGASVQNLGQAPKTMGINNNANDGYGITPNQINLPGANYQATLIQDPATVAPASTAPANPNGVAAHPALNTGAVANTQATIDQLPGLLQAALASEGTNHQNAVNTFNQQEQTQTGAHDAGTVTNQQNYDSNFMDSIRAGIKGLGGLMAVLRGSGAAGGTADDDVQNTVGGITSDDIRNGADTQKNNQGALDSSLSQFLTDLKGKRQANEDTYVNNQHAIQRDNATQMQDLYSKMAGFYGDAGQTGQANDFLAKAGSFTPTIAANSRTQTSNYDTAPVVIHAPNLTSFAAPTQPAAATAPQDGQVGSGIFAMNSNRRPSKDSSTPAAAAPAMTAPVAQGA